MIDDAIRAIEPAEVAKMLPRGEVLLIDVREPQEFAEERIAGALLYPLSSFDAVAMPWGAMPNVVFHCGSGKRSLVAAQKRLAAGGRQVAHMTGGLAAWKAQGLKVLGSAKP